MTKFIPHSSYSVCIFVDGNLSHAQKAWVTVSAAEKKKYSELAKKENEGKLACPVFLAGPIPLRTQPSRDCHLLNFSCLIIPDA